MPANYARPYVCELGAIWESVPYASEIWCPILKVPVDGVRRTRIFRLSNCYRNKREKGYRIEDQIDG